MTFSTVTVKYIQPYAFIDQDWICKKFAVEMGNVNSHLPCVPVLNQVANKDLVAYHTSNYTRDSVPAMWGHIHICYGVPSLWTRPVMLVVDLNGFL